MIAFVGSVFSPYYHWRGRRDPDNHVAFNVALYGPHGNVWTMTERGRRSLNQTAECLQIGPSSFQFERGSLVIMFDEMAMPWPGQRWLPKRVRGKIVLRPEAFTTEPHSLDYEGHHSWLPRAPICHASVECDVFPEGSWTGRGYHDINFGNRPIEQDFDGWDWARGDADSGTQILYDARLRDGRRRRIGLRISAEGEVAPVDIPERRPMKAGFWGVRGGIACDEDHQPIVVRALEDTPFYSRALVQTTVAGERLTMMQETLDCDRLANPVVRLMLPFKMPRRA